MADDDFLRETLERHAQASGARRDQGQTLQDRRDAATRGAHVLMDGAVADVLRSAARQLQEAGYWCQAVTERGRASLELGPDEAGGRRPAVRKFRTDVEGDINAFGDYPASGHMNVPHGEIPGEVGARERVQAVVRAFVSNALAG
jgi:hypothetical protein